MRLFSIVDPLSGNLAPGFQAVWPPRASWITIVGIGEKLGALVGLISGAVPLTTLPMMTAL
jgi:hypothetical protein